VSDAKPPTRKQAIALLRRGRAGTDALLERVPRNRMTTPGLGGGEWSPKDLIGHLASWEEFALEALDAWAQGERAEVDRLWLVGTSEINSGNVRRKASWSLARVRKDAAETHEALLEAIGSMSDATWRTPATKRARKPLGVRLGGILGGPRGPFRHDEAHHPSIETFLDMLGR
jgi:hypothetical protein